MLNLIKMDLYRLFHSVSTWVMVFVTVGMATFAVSMTCYDVSLMKEEAVSMQQEIGTQMDEDGVSINVGIYTETNPEWLTGEVKFSELVNLQISSGLFLIAVSIFVAIFVNGDQKNGYIKNIAGQFPNRSVLILSKTVVVGVQVLFMFLVLAVTMFVVGSIGLGEKLVLDSVGELLRVLVGQYVMHFAFAELVLCICTLWYSAALGMTIGILLACKVSSMLYSAIARGYKDLSNYALEVNVTRFAQMTDGKEIGIMMLSAAAVFLVTGGLSMVAMRRDVK